MNHMSTPYKNILVIRTDRIGDVVLTTPMIALLRKMYPQSKITILVTPQTREIVDGNPYLNEIMIDDRKKLHKGLTGYIKLIQEVKKRTFDLAIVLHTKKRTTLLCFLAGIPNRIGYKNNKLGFLLTQGIADMRPQGIKHEVQYCLDVLNYIKKGTGEPTDQSNFAFHPSIKEIRSLSYLKPYVSTKKESEEWVKREFSKSEIKESDDVIAIHPGASCISKRWPVKNFAELISKIHTKHQVKIILVGGDDTRAIAEEISQLTSAPIIDFVGKTNLSQFISLLKHCRLLISNDSGPVHLAGALNVKVLAIFGRNQSGLNPQRWGPLGEDSVVLHKDVGCQVCLAHRCVIGFKCLEAITPQEVLEIFDSLSRL